LWFCEDQYALNTDCLLPEHRKGERSIDYRERKGMKAEWDKGREKLGPLYELLYMALVITLHVKNLTAWWLLCAYLGNV